MGNADYRLFIGLGPSRKWYLIGSALFVAGLIFSYTVGYTVHSDRVAAATDHLRSDDPHSAQLTIAEPGTYTVWLEALAGGAEPTAARGPLPRLAEIRATTESGDQVIPQPSVASDYLLARNGETRVGKAIGDIDVPAGGLGLTVEGADGAARAVAVGREPALGTRGAVTAVGVLAAAGGVLVWLVTGLLRRSGRKRFVAASRAPAAYPTVPYQGVR